MDWSKSKSIFIIVFLILNVFLYSLYLNRHTEAQQFEVLSEKKIEARLNDDNITYENLPTNVDNISYISARVKDFSEEELKLQNVKKPIIIENSHKLTINLEKPIEIKDPSNEVGFNDFLQTHVYNGSSYILWEVDEESRKAVFFQRANDKTIYNNINGTLFVYWNEENEIISYEQTMLEEIEKVGEEKQLHQPFEIIQVLYSNRMLEQNSEIIDMNLGYSTIVQQSTQQVFVPTWIVQVKLADETVEEFFVNAIDGKIIDVQLEIDPDEEIEEVNESNEIKMEVSRE